MLLRSGAVTRAHRRSQWFRCTPLLLLAAALFSSYGCEKADQSSPEPASTGVFELTARGLAFDGPATFPAGWVTFRFENASPMTHFALIERMPPGFGIAEQQAQVAPVFQEGMNLLNQGDADAAMLKFGDLPQWFNDVVILGGPGLLAPGRTVEATVYLEPGDYLIECYIKTDGIFHSYNPAPDSYGMVHAVTITDAPSAAPEPDPTLSITLSSDLGLSVEGDPVAGEHTVAVTFADQRLYENFVGHDVHLARLSEETDIARLAAWMDWTEKTGFETPAPVEFLGGLHEMPEGNTGYFKVRLEPGRYAWIAEVPRAAERGMLEIFTVPGS